MFLVNSYAMAPSQISEEDSVDSQGQNTYAQEYQDYMRKKEN